MTLNYHPWPALAFSFRLGAKRVAGEPFAVAGSVAIFWALLTSYGMMFQAIPTQDLARLHLTAVDLMWYFVITEIVMAFGFYYHREIQDDIRSGAMEIQLLRPVEFWPLKLADWFGQSAARLIVIVPACFAIAYFTCGVWALGAGTILLVIPSLLVSGLMTLCAHLLIGASSLWVGDCRPVYWIWQKLLFLFGAVLWPLTIFPPWFRHVALATPFPAFLAVPGGLALSPGARGILAGAGYQLAWLAALLLLSGVMGRAVRRTLTHAGD